MKACSYYHYIHSKISFQGFTPTPLQSSPRSQLIFNMTSACLGGLELFLAITSQLKNSDLQHCIWIDTEIDIDIEINIEIDIERH